MQIFSRPIEFATALLPTSVYPSLRRLHKLGSAYDRQWTDDDREPRRTDMGLLDEGTFQASQGFF